MGDIYELLTYKFKQLRLEKFAFWGRISPGKSMLNVGLSWPPDQIEGFSSKRSLSSYWGVNAIRNKENSVMKLLIILPLAFAIVVDAGIMGDIGNLASDLADNLTQGVERIDTGSIADDLVGRTAADHTSDLSKGLSEGIEGLSSVTKIPNNDNLPLPGKVKDLLTLL
ncbi:unnamed protein product [Hermetia illucens]|uniref:Uncharacterized protein n=1 Tax=Hermetia illucens TaxID=343691 RepID=A0A7R8YWS3_HERIL|nr:unnamed protein product [Hermetia illucens]